MRWRLIIEDFGPNIQHIAAVENILADTLSRLPSLPRDKYEPCTRKAQCSTKKLFAIVREESNEKFPPLNILIVQREQQKEPRNINSNLSTYIYDQGSGYSMQELDNVEIICYDSKIYVPQSMRRRVLDWYHLYLNHPGGSRLEKKSGRYVIGKALSHKRRCSLICGIHVNSSKREKIFMDICHLRIS